MSLQRAFAAAALLPLVLLLWTWPLSLPPLFAGLCVYAAILVWRPQAWMVLLPASFPLVDLTPWSGWMLFGEPDMIWLVTIIVLLLRETLVLPRLSRFGAIALIGTSAATVIAVGIGYTSSAPPGGSDLIYLTAQNGLRLAKPWFEALALLPFLAGRSRARLDLLLGGAALLGCGIAVSVAVERSVFVGLFNFADDYRVVGTFSSMHVGGGHIGAALALVLGCVVAGFGTRLRGWMLLVLIPVLYALAVTYARAAYAAGMVASVAAAVATLISALKPGLDPRRLLPLAAAMLVAGLVGVAALDTPLMSGRFTTVAGDLETREGNWRHGLALHQGGVLGWIFGEGLGSFPRIAAQSAADAGQASGGPSYYRLLDAGSPALELVSRTPLYLGHRVDGVAPGETLSLSLRYRVHAPDTSARPLVAAVGSVGAILCEKLLLYSMDCASAGFTATHPGVWEDGVATLVVPPHPGRPLELSFTSSAGSVVDLADIHLNRARGEELLANGDFSAGTDRWFFTDDNHLVWRMKDQFLMTLFETGIFGLITWLALILAASVGSLRALLRGEAGIAAGVAAVVAALLVNALFDAVLEAPRLAFVMDLFLVTGVLLERESS